MPRIEMDAVELVYPVRENRGLTLKELVLHHLFRRKTQTTWRSVNALRGVSLRVENGERVGVIGYNGAGKSTLLRMIAGVYPITNGKRLVDGNVCSLFDIGLGFEFTATGWENMRFRGYLQGETPRTLQKKMNEIADFTELGEFLNLPLNCYSTGMVMRLAFAIATSSEPEILLVDEVFGTGDIIFQKKAEKRMHDLMDKAKIVMMVGHSIDFFEIFCTRILWMQQGQIRMDGPPKEVVAAYRAEVNSRQAAAALAA